MIRPKLKQIIFFTSANLSLLSYRTQFVANAMPLITMDEQPQNILTGRSLSVPYSLFERQRYLDQTADSQNAPTSSNGSQTNTPPSTQPSNSQKTAQQNGASNPSAAEVNSDDNLNGGATQDSNAEALAFEKEKAAAAQKENDGKLPDDKEDTFHQTVASYITVGIVAIFILIFCIGSCFVKVHKVIDAIVEKDEPEINLSKISDMRKSVSDNEAKIQRENNSRSSSPFTLACDMPFPQMSIRKNKQEEQDMAKVQPQEDYLCSSNNENSITILAATMGMQNVLESVDSDKFENGHKKQLQDIPKELRNIDSQINQGHQSIQKEDDNKSNFSIASNEQAGAAKENGN